MDTTKTVTHLSLCSGYEGIGLGLRRVFPNLREIAYVEREGFPISNLVKKVEDNALDAAPLFTDVKTFPYRRFLNKVSILSGGFPCQPFSAAGVRQGVEDPRHLYPYISKGIKECRPTVVFLENVEGIISSKTANGESVLKYVLSDLEEMGYRATAGIFSASEVGAPHQRKRVFIMGYSESECNGLNETEWKGRDTTSTTSEELVNTYSNGHSKHTTTPKAEPIGGTEATIMPRSHELPNTENIGCGGRSDRDFRGGRNIQEQETQEQSDIRSEAEGCGRDFSNTNSQGLEGVRECNTSERWQTPNGQLRSYCEAWPARPNEQQHEWEEPRTKPKLGRAANGASNRVDRLRLLGNGVVPATAERAFRVLSSKILGNP